MEDMNEYQSAGLQDKWMLNTYENLVKCERLLVIAKRSNDPEERFEATKHIVTELELGLSDSCAYIGVEPYKKFQKKLDTIKSLIDKESERGRFLRIRFSQESGKILGSSITPFLYDTIEVLAKLRTELIILLKDILYIKVSYPE